MPFRDSFPPVEVAIELEPEELAGFVLRDLSKRGRQTDTTTRLVVTRNCSSTPGRAAISFVLG